MSSFLIRRGSTSNSMRAVLRPQQLLTLTNRVRLPLHRHLAGASTVAFTNIRPHDSNARRTTNNLWLAAGLTAGSLGFLSTNAVACEENKEEKPPQEEEEDDMTIGPDDPYYNVPETDEPTDCSMCLTFRQGPCRVDWKRFELCVKDKDNKKDENGKPVEQDPTACMKYAMPFYHCSSKFVNTYLILGVDQTQKTVIEPLMETYNEKEAQSRRVCYNNNNTTISMDWTHWENFVTTLVDLGGHVPTRFQLEKTEFRSPAEALKKTWADENGEQYLMMNEHGEPFLITVTAQVPKVVDGEKDDTSLFMTFALDQSGNLMGDARNHDNDEKEEETKEGEEEAPKEEPSTHLPLLVQIVPGVSQEFTVYSLYVPKDGDFLTDGILYESKPYKLETITEKATKKAKSNAVEAKQTTESQGREVMSS